MATGTQDYLDSGALRETAACILRARAEAELELGLRPDAVQAVPHCVLYGLSTGFSGNHIFKLGLGLGRFYP